MYAFSPQSLGAAREFAFHAALYLSMAFDLLTPIPPIYKPTKVEPPQQVGLIGL